MFRNAIRTLSLFRNVHRRQAFRSIEQPKLYNDAFNMFMLSAFVKESFKNITNFREQNEPNEPNESNNNEYCEYCTNFVKHERELKIVCQITGCEKRKNNIDCSCKDKCIVDKSEVSIICDL